MRPVGRNLPPSGLRRRRRVRGAILATLAIFGVAAALWYFLRPRHTPGAADPLAGVDATQAYRTGLDLLERRLAAASLPHFRHALALDPNLWNLHSDYASALLNAVGEARSRFGMARSMTRSSAERVAMIGEAFREFDRAESLAPAPSDRAYVIALRAQALANWGLSWDALTEYRRAQRLDPASGEWQRRRVQLARVMRDLAWPGANPP